jgi:hypothetical protein
MKRIKLTQGKFAFVDDSNFKELNKYKWYYSYYGYAVRARSRRLNVEGKRKFIRMHREIMRCPKGKEVDHIDGNKLNNQKYNLRICTSSQNRMNKGKHFDNTSGYKGVSFVRGKIISKIMVEGKIKYLGTFPDVISAAKAYDSGALKYHGKFANLNFPKGVV